jgi:hypothetical protein
MMGVGYSNIVDAFQIAYAIGLLAAGRLVYKVGPSTAKFSLFAFGSFPDRHSNLCVGLKAKRIDR